MQGIASVGPLATFCDHLLGSSLGLSLLSDLFLREKRGLLCCHLLFCEATISMMLCVWADPAIPSWGGCKAGVHMQRERPVLAHWCGAWCLKPRDSHQGTCWPGSPGREAAGRVALIRACYSPWEVSQVVRLALRGPSPGWGGHLLQPAPSCGQGRPRT